MTKGAFLSFVMWALIFIAATVGYRASKQNEPNRYMRCTYKKSIIMLMFASLFGIWKLMTNHEMMKQMRRLDKAHEGKGQKMLNKHGKKNFNWTDEKAQWF